MFTVDLRSCDEFYLCHLNRSANLPWPAIQQRLNELPKPGSELILVGLSNQLVLAKQWLKAKQYLISDEILVKNAQKYPLPPEFYSKVKGFLPESEMVKSSSESEILWSPSSLVAYLSNHKKRFYSRGATAIDLGCGGGRDAVYLSIQQWLVTAVEHKRSVIQRAENLAENLNQKMEFLCCDLTSAACLDKRQFDLVLGVRFLDRASFPKIKQMVKPGGYIAWQTFSEGCEAYGSPKNPNFILKAGELAETFNDFEVVLDRIESLEDGRPVNSFIARRPDN